MKKVVALAAAVLTLLLCTGCKEKTVPDPAVEAYLNTGLTAQKACAAVAQVEYTVRESKQNKAGEESGSYVFQVKIDQTDPENASLIFDQTYTGSYMDDGVSNRQIRLEKVEGTYLFTTVNDGEVSQEEVEQQFVTDYLTSFFYVNNNAYDEGGLYYGDFFMLYIYQYPASSFFVDTQTNQCVFDEKMDIRNGQTGNVHLHQISRINSYGLLEQNYERFESMEQDMVLISELSASYVLR